jgi:hypothetical protein
MAAKGLEMAGKNSTRRAKAPAKREQQTETAAGQSDAMDLDYEDPTDEESVELQATGEAAARAAARDQLAADVEAFLKRGGAIMEVPKDFRADPPRKPQNNYGKGSI